MAIKSFTNKRDKEIKYEVIEDYGSLSGDEDATNGKRLRLVKWNNGEPKYDIRPWSLDENGNEIMGKGVTLTGEELNELLEILKRMDAGDSE